MQRKGKVDLIARYDQTESELAVAISLVPSKPLWLATANGSLVCVAHGRNTAQLERAPVNCSHVAEVGVNAGDGVTVARNDIGDGDRTLGLGGAVSAGTVELAKVLDAVVLDHNGSTTVVLDNLVVGVSGTSATDRGGPGALLDGDSILANVLEPYVLKGAGALAMYTLSLVCADDHVSENSTSVQNEDSVLVSPFSLSTASAFATVESDVTAIEGASDASSTSQGGSSGGGGEVAAGRARGDGLLRSGGRWGGADESSEGDKCGKGRVQHDDGCDRTTLASGTKWLSGKEVS